ncbi:MAG: phosphoribosylformylglycinamidine synthase subunit PurS [Acidobacteria bacterium]|nr:phosphoribosylformylglycinamidine synthase subunit PurS [Acidobacteriota bacterium]
MRAKVYVTLKRDVLDPQGKTVQRAVKSLGFKEVLEVRQGKYFELALPDDVAADRARQVVEEIARTVLTNTVIEDFRFELEGA